MEIKRITIADTTHRERYSAPPPPKRRERDSVRRDTATAAQGRACLYCSNVSRRHSQSSLSLSIASPLIEAPGSMVTPTPTCASFKLAPSPTSALLQIMQLDIVTLSCTTTWSIRMQLVSFTFEPKRQCGPTADFFTEERAPTSTPKPRALSAENPM